MNEKKMEIMRLAFNFHSDERSEKDERFIARIGIMNESSKATVESMNVVAIFR